MKRLSFNQSKAETHSGEMFQLRQAGQVEVDGERFLVGTIVPAKAQQRRCAVHIARSLRDEIDMVLPNEGVDVRFTEDEGGWLAAFVAKGVPTGKKHDAAYMRLKGADMNTLLHRMETL